MKSFVICCNLDSMCGSWTKELKRKVRNSGYKSVVEEKCICLDFIPEILFLNCNIEKNKGSH